MFSVKEAFVINTQLYALINQLCGPPGKMFGPFKKPRSEYFSYGANSTPFRN